MKTYELKTEINSKYDGAKYACSIKVLSQNHTCINSDFEVYNFDSLVDGISRKQKLTTADALYVGNKRVLLIELKTGFDNKKYAGSSDKLFKENLKRAIRLKACESLIILEKILCGGQKSEFIKTYVTVIDGSDDPIGSRSKIFSSISEDDEEQSERKRILKDMQEHSLLIYQKETSGEQIMYNEVVVLYDHDFDAEIKKYFN